MMEDIDRDTIDFRDNYDQTRREPAVFPDGGKVPELRSVQRRARGLRSE